MMRKEGSTDFERAIRHSNNLKQLRESSAEYKGEVKSSLQLPMELLKSITERLELKGKPFQVFDSASIDEISDFRECLHFIDPLTLSWAESN